jgi:hypothetical protein
MRGRCGDLQGSCGVIAGVQELVWGEMRLLGAGRDGCCGSEVGEEAAMELRKLWRCSATWTLVRKRASAMQARHGPS